MSDKNAIAKLTLCFLAAVLASVAANASPIRVKLPLNSCSVPNGTEAGRCGHLNVPENWDQPDGRQIALNIIVLPKIGQGAEQAPMVWLDGGPGIAGTSSAVLYTEELKFHRNRRAVIMFDQRGTGGSGALHCPEIERRSPLDDLWIAADVVSCRRALEAHADLSQYSTLAAARDLEAVRSALGYEKIDLAGLSYGTLLAQTYLKLYPNHVRSVALIGTVPMGEKLPLHHSANAERALRQVFDDCRLDKACRAAFPRLREDWHVLQRHLSNAPIVIAPGPNAPVVRKGPFNEFIRGMLNTPDGQRRLPLFISRAARGDFRLLMGAAKAQGPEPLAEGLYLSVVCAEATRRIRESEIAPAVAASSFGRYRIDQQIAACRLWAPSPSSSIVAEPLRSNIPVLLLSGGRDATTPASWAKRVALGLRNSRVIHFKYMTHIPVGLQNIVCVDQLMDAFYSAASVRSLDASCRNTTRPPPFAVTLPQFSP